jgi:hypothetical protein
MKFWIRVKKKQLKELQDLMPGMTPIEQACEIFDTGLEAIRNRSKRIGFVSADYYEREEGHDGPAEED